MASDGECLFSQLFGDRGSYAAYEIAKRQGLEQLRFEIAGSPSFHALHWEALKDAKLPLAFSLTGPMVRNSPTSQLLTMEMLWGERRTR